MPMAGASARQELRPKKFFRVGFGLRAWYNQMIFQPLLEDSESSNPLLPASQSFNFRHKRKR